MFKLNVPKVRDEHINRSTIIYYLGILKLIKNSKSMSPTKGLTQLYCNLIGIHCNGIEDQLDASLRSFFKQSVQNRIDEIMEILVSTHNREIRIPANVYDDIVRIQETYATVTNVNKYRLIADIKTFSSNLRMTRISDAEEANFIHWREYIYDRNDNNDSNDIVIDVDKIPCFFRVIRSTVRKLITVDDNQLTPMVCELLDGLLRLRLSVEDRDVDTTKLINSCYTTRKNNRNFIRDPYVLICMDKDTPDMNFYNVDKSTGRVLPNEFYYSMNKLRNRISEKENSNCPEVADC